MTWLLTQIGNAIVYVAGKIGGGSGSPGGK